MKPSISLSNGRRSAQKERSIPASSTIPTGTTPSALLSTKDGGQRSVTPTSKAGSRLMSVHREMAQTALPCVQGARCNYLDLSLGSGEEITVITNSVTTKMSYKERAP